MNAHTQMTRLIAVLAVLLMREASPERDAALISVAMVIRNIVGDEGVLPALHTAMVLKHTRETEGIEILDRDGESQQIADEIIKSCHAEIVVALNERINTPDFQEGLRELRELVTTFNRPVPELASLADFDLSSLES